MERILFIKEFPAEMWKNINYEIRKTFTKYLEANLFNQIHNVIRFFSLVVLESITSTKMNDTGTFFAFSSIKQSEIFLTLFIKIMGFLGTILQGLENS